jgi:hypothetical protein
MSKAMQGYYELLELIEKKHPEKAFLKPKEAAEIMGVNIKTIMTAINKKYNPLPARNVGAGVKNKSYIIPVTELARWAVARR